MSYLWEGGEGRLPDNDLVGRKGYGLVRSHSQHVSYQLHVPDNDLVEVNSFFAKFISRNMF